MKTKILIIEDDVFLGDVLLQKMSVAGYETHLSRDGGDGMKMISSLKPDLILLDLHLPTMSGYEILEQKFKDQNINRIPVIVISNSGEPVEIDKILSLNVKDYFVKAQFDPDEVLTKVKMQLKEGENTSGRKEGATKSQRTLKGKTIMWVEDDVFLSDIIARKLSNEECKLLHAASGDTALAMIEKEMPDIVLLDILIPGIDGFEILSRVKANPALKKIPVILLSNLGQKDDIEKGQKLGAERFLVKATVTLDEIVEEIKKVVFS
ncbi:MAG: hypothetical protein A2928_03625 [Candidatus Taylorbacteria bacterium RIFCSPLOWO2_01_FULL_45_15b]|uniref:Response regulatory domain-containing protein n=1 Tax=Candidatus Taylorbacteria bacterium RIFCSPLOWO2_01_FULL_45_15b TaxID=1802319 RepID=A0A1G2NER1_9BACT|nr:MAG: hypothetical protein A2928_03625 [Candidatus Taylorbacteria bacterium RIFCSPLOWO2_01_FULL_45_15b]